MGDNVKVVIRIRPLNSRELQEGARRCLDAQIERSSVTLEAKPKAKTFTYDFVADEDISQDEIFQVVGKPITTSCMSGYNGTVFAYGQTGAGKTHTILGPEDCVEGSPNYDERGLLPRCIEFLFASINREQRRCEGLEFLVKCSFIEIYNEQVIDLLANSQAPLSIREDLKLGVYVENLTELIATSANDTYAFMKQGTQHRHVGATSMNKESSRSHSVFTMLIESRKVKQGFQNFRSSRFHLIDLAGSERQKSTEAAGTRLKEAGMINKSLSALGSVINALVDISEGKTRHVHYRDSKLTFLLKDSLGGNSKTCIVAAVSPSASAFGETLSTLKFAQRAKMIRNKAVVNEDLTGNVESLKEQVRQLKEQLSKTQQQGAKPSDYSLITMNARVGELETLLESNLKLRQEVEVALQNELEAKDALIVQLSETVSKFERKIANDKMILKMREASIARLQQGLPPDVQKLHEEIEMLRESVDMPPIAAKLLAENDQLKAFIENLQKEISFDPYSLRYRMRENQEFTNKLANSLQESAVERAQLKVFLEELACYKNGELIASPVKRKFEAELAKYRTGDNESFKADLDDSAIMVKLEVLEKENSRLSSLLEESSFRLNKSQNESESSFNDSLYLNTSVRAFKLALKDAARASSLETELEACRSELESKELEVADLTDQLEVISEAHEYLKEQFKSIKAGPKGREFDETSAEINRLINQLHAKEAIETDLKLQVKELENQLEGVNVPTTRYSSEDLDYYKLEYQTLLVESDTVKTENAELNRKVEKLEGLLGEAEDKEKAYQAEMQKLAEDIDWETNKLTTELTEAYETLLRVKTESEETINRCKSEYETLKSLADQADAERIKAVQQLQDLQKTQAKEVEAAKAQIAALKNSLEQQASQKETQSANEVGLRSQITKLTEKLTLMTKNEMVGIEAQKQVVSLKKQLEVSREESAQLKEYLAQVEEKLLEAKQKEAEVKQAQDQKASELYVEMTNEVQELSERLAGSQGVVETLSAENKALRQKVEAFEADTSEVKNKFVESLTNRESVLQQLTQLREQEYQKSLENSELRAKLEAAQLKNSQLAKELDQVNKENERLGGHANLSQKIKLHSKLKEENNKLKTANFKLTEDLRKSKMKFETVNKKYLELAKREGLGDVDISGEAQLRREVEDLNEEVARAKRFFGVISAELGETCITGDDDSIVRTIDSIQSLRRHFDQLAAEMQGKNLEIQNLNSELRIMGKELSLRDYKESLGSRSPFSETGNRLA
mmetsp:Transcript_1154/g.2782  ORF Transcript_1154/g.2782 Transcript_1154/m.2782 type:complete len:1261 (-) Transcript_1154:2331-6113(-)